MTVDASGKFIGLACSIENLILYGGILKNVSFCFFLYDFDRCAVKGGMLGYFQWFSSIFYSNVRDTNQNILHFATCAKLME